MAQFNGMTLTKGGRELLAKALTGKLLNFVRVTAGDGLLTEGQDKYEMTELVQPVLDLPITSLKVTGVGIATIKALASNEHLETPFFIRELGLFAQDPDTLEEILYGYCNAADRADYLPAGGGPDLVQYLLSLVTVIEQAQNVTAVISEGLVWATHEEVDDKIDSLFDKAAPIYEFWIRTQGDNHLLRPASLRDVKYAILGITSIESLNRRVEVLENITANVLLALETIQLYPDYTNFIIEDFLNPDQVDLFRCKVTSIAAGDNSVDCEMKLGILRGGTYTISDGLKSEQVQVQSVSTENGINRVVLVGNIQNTYQLAYTYLYRTSADIHDGYATGPTGNKTQAWTPTLVWRGQGAAEEYEIPLEVSVGGIEQYDISGDVQITSDGFVTLGGE